ncbi:MAG TPA: OB-fold nucleic acid binding domain-containing protein [Actinomycetota bacterium]
MGVIDPIRRFLRRMAETDEQRYGEEIEAWASRIPGTVRIRDAGSRSRVRLAGVVRRITVRPLEGSESLEALLYDGTGEVTVVWMGRRTIPGLTLGTRLVVEGLLAEQRSGRRVVNPSFEFAS